MGRLIFIALFSVVLLLFVFSGCKHRKKTEKTDNATLHYLDYGKIYAAYKSAPVYYAQEMLDSFLTAFPTDARAWAFYGRVMYDLNNTEKSVAAYRKSIQYDSLFADGYLGLGSVYTYLNQYDSANLYLNKALRLNDSSGYTYLNLSLLNMKADNKAQSLAYADSAFFHFDSSAVVCSGLSYIYAKQNQPQQSEAMFEKAIALHLKDTTTFREVLNGTLKLEDYYRKNKY